MATVCGGHPESRYLSDLSPFMSIKSNIVSQRMTGTSKPDTMAFTPKKRGSCRCSVQKSWNFVEQLRWTQWFSIAFQLLPQLGIWYVLYIYIWYTYIYIYITYVLYIYIPQNSWWNPYECPVHVPWIPSGRIKFFAQGPKSPHMAPPFCALGHSECSWSVAVRTPVDHPLIKITRKSWKITIIISD